VPLGRQRIERLHVRVLERVIQVTLEPLRVFVRWVALRDLEADPLRTRSLNSISHVSS
jgi:hypothetical protein